MNCRYCDRSVPDGRGPEHVECGLTWEGRWAARVCVRCGTEKAAGGSRCGACGSTSPYLGYPGGLE